jgi:hypothetical protein
MTVVYTITPDGGAFAREMGSSSESLLVRADEVIR